MAQAVCAAERFGREDTYEVGIGIVGHGIALPARSVDNEQLGRELGVTAGWIESRCGIRRRAIAEGESTASLAVLAGRDALGGRVADAVICATFTPDYPLCPVAPAVASELGLDGSAAFDVNGACAGGVIALLLAADLVQCGAYRSVLVIAADTTTKFLRSDDAATRVLFGDGAAALLIQGRGGVQGRVVARVQGADGAGAALFRVELGGSARPANRRGHVAMQGRSLFRFAVNTGIRIVTDLCVRGRCEPASLSRVVLHQANCRIVEAIAAGTGIDARACVTTSPVVGNLGAASALHAFITDLRAHEPSPGDRTLVAAFGAGLTWAGALIEW